MHCLRRTNRDWRGVQNVFNSQQRWLVTQIANGNTLTIRTLLAESSHGQHEESEFEVSGFVQSLRKQKKVVFVAVRDGSCMQTLQAVLRPEQGRDLSVGQAVSLRGTLKRCPDGAKQSHELLVSDAVAPCENDAESAPIQNKYQSPKFLRTIPHLRPRLPSQAVLLNLRSKVTGYCQQFFDSCNFVQTHPPLITSSDCEGAGEVFTVASGASGKQEGADAAEHHFRTPKYLTVSAQLHLEALAQAVDRVWCLSPTFRAEKSDTARHLSEFYMLEAEMSFTRSVDDVMDVVEQLVRSIVGETVANKDLRSDLLARLKSSRPPDEDHLDEPVIDEAALEARWAATTRTEPWVRVTYDAAFQTLTAAVESGEKHFTTPPDYAAGLHSEHEKFLAEKLGHGAPVFIYNYPWEQKPFYMLRDAASKGKFAACFDLIAPDVCELAGGSLREHHLEPLRDAMREKGLLAEDADEAHGLEWYLDLRRYGSAPHGGFGIGFDRLLCFVAGVSNVRDMVTFPRYFGRCDT